VIFGREIYESYFESSWRLTQNLGVTLGSELIQLKINCAYFSLSEIKIKVITKARPKSNSEVLAKSKFKLEFGSYLTNYFGRSYNMTVNIWDSDSLITLNKLSTFSNIQFSKVYFNTKELNKDIYTELGRNIQWAKYVSEISINLDVSTSYSDIELLLIHMNEIEDCLPILINCKNEHQLLHIFFWDQIIEGMKNIQIWYKGKVTNNLVKMINVITKDINKDRIHINFVNIDSI